MSPTVTTFVFESANFLVLAAMLSWLFFHPVRQALADRRDRFVEEGHRAAQIMEDAKQAQQQIETTRSRLEQELAETRTRELKAVQNQCERLLADARENAERQLESGRREISRLSLTQRDRLARAAALAAADSVEVLLRQLGGPEIQAALVRSACQQLSALSREALAPVKVETARELTREERAELDRALGAAAAEADFRIAEELGVGIRVTTARGLIDASASGLSRFASQSLLRYLNQRSDNGSINSDELKSDQDG